MQVAIAPNVAYNDCCGTPKPPYIQVLQKQQYNYNLPDISLRVTPHLQLKNLIVSQNRLATYYTQKCN